MITPTMTDEHIVMMFDGTFKFAKDIQVGDKVMGYKFQPITVSKIIQGEQGNGNPTITIVKK